MAVKLIRQDPGIQPGLGGVAFANSCDGIAVGEDGIIIRTNDGGVSWSPEPSGFNGTLRDVAYVDANYAIAVGDDCTILRWTSSTNAWSAIPTKVPFLRGKSNVLSGVGFNNANVGYAVGTIIMDGDPSVQGIQQAVLLTTTDGGVSWIHEFPLNDKVGTLVDLAFVPGTNDVVAVGGGTVGVGGFIIRAPVLSIWTEPMRQNSNTEKELLGVDFADADNGWAVGRDGTILHTGNGGKTWEPQTSGFGESSHLLRIAAIDKDHVWAVGTDGKLIATSDRGENWVPQKTDLGLPLTDVVFTDPCHGTVVGASGTVRTVLGRA